MTTISHQLFEPSLVVITIYNVSGQLDDVFKTLDLQSGYHSMVWDAHGMSTGLYIYKISTGT